MRIYTANELCEQLHICRCTLWKWYKSGKIKFERIGQRLFVSADEVERLGLK